MERVIVIRFGEIFLKGKNRDYFESLLIKNIKHAVKDVPYTFSRSQGRYFLENFSEDDEGELLDRLKKVFGIHSLSVADKVPTLATDDFAEIRKSLAVIARSKAVRKGRNRTAGL